MKKKIDGNLFTIPRLMEILMMAFMGRLKMIET